MTYFFSLNDQKETFPYPSIFLPFFCSELVHDCWSNHWQFGYCCRILSLWFPNCSWYSKVMRWFTSYQAKSSQIKPSIVCLFVNLLCDWKNVCLGPKVRFWMAEHQQHSTSQTYPNELPLQRVVVAAVPFIIWSLGLNTHFCNVITKIRIGKPYLVWLGFVTGK